MFFLKKAFSICNLIFALFLFLTGCATISLSNKIDEMNQGLKYEKFIGIDSVYKHENELLLTGWLYKRNIKRKPIILKLFRSGSETNSFKCNDSIGKNGVCFLSNSYTDFWKYIKKNKYISPRYENGSYLCYKFGKVDSSWTKINIENSGYIDNLFYDNINFETFCKIANKNNLDSLFEIKYYRNGIASLKTSNGTHMHTILTYCYKDYNSNKIYFERYLFFELDTIIKGNIIKEKTMPVLYIFTFLFDSITIPIQIAVLLINDDLDFGAQ